MYQKIDDFRAKLLGFLPLVSGTGIFFLLSESTFKVDRRYLLAVGLFGFAVTLGLLFYELRGVQRCVRIMNVAAMLEEEMNLIGPFRLRVRSFYGFINEPVAAGIIYPSVLSAWAYVAMHSIGNNNTCLIVSILVFIGILTAVLLLFYTQFKNDPKYLYDLKKIMSGKGRFQNNVGESE